MESNPSNPPPDDNQPATPQWKPCGSIYFTLKTKAGQQAIGSFFFYGSDDLASIGGFLKENPGYELLTMEALAGDIAKAIRARPTPTEGVQPTGQPRPVCPEHHIYMKASIKHPGEFHCTYDNDELGWCKITFKQGRFYKSGKPV